MNEMLTQARFHEKSNSLEVNGALVCFAESESDFAMVEEVWKEVYFEELGWLKEQGCDPRSDRYHGSSKYVLAKDENGEPIGVMRVVVNSRIGLPIEQFIDIADIKTRCEGRIIECARLMVPKRHRDVRIPGYPFGVYAAMVKATLHYCLQEGIYDVMANCFKYTETTPIKSLLQFGFKDLNMEFVDDLSEASVCTALHLDIRDMLSGMYAAKRKFSCYMISHDDLFSIYQ